MFENPDLVARHASVLQKLKKKKEQPVQSNLRASSSFSNIATKSKLQSLNSNESNESKIIRSSSQKNISQGEEKKTIKRMASFFGQALEALGLDDAESRSEASRGISHADKSELSETFTIFYGTQVRQMWNIRLIASKFEDVLLPSLDSTQELAMRTQTLSNLYGHDLSAAILLTTRNQFQNYMKIGTRSKFILKCKSSTEFHFNDISTQLETIYKSNQNFQEGDFFVTRHSNIPNIHAVFHLIISDDSISTDVTSQSKLITGYRSILKTCQLCDVHNITIPLLLLDDDIVSDTTFVTNKSQTTSIEQVLYKRCELVLKSTKGLIQEYSRGIKHAGQTGGVDKFPRSLTFVLPVLRGESQSGFSRTRVVYGAVREKLAEIFRQY